MSAKVFDVILLTALPASGKSEVRTYLEHGSKEKRAEDFHMGDTIQLDDYPYVHLMRRFDEELDVLGKPTLFFKTTVEPFIDPREWGTLIELVNEDFDDVIKKNEINPTDASTYVFDRIDAAAKKVGIPNRIATVDPESLKVIADKLRAECQDFVEVKRKLSHESLENKTIVIEFARGGPQGSSLPLPEGFGYQYSFAHLSEELLNRAVVLYIWVTPEDSRRKNEERAKPNEQGSILHHGVPHVVMINDYGTDDINYLIEKSDKPNTVVVEAYGKTFNLPLAKFDNRDDLTTFLREDPRAWKQEDVDAVHGGLKSALDALAKIAL